MSELIQQNDNRATIRWKLLTGASVLALTSYIATANLARAEDADRPTLWIELGGQMESVQGLTAPFTPPFITAVTPTPDPYKKDIFSDNQRAARFAFGAEGKITFQPEDSNWLFSAGIRYGRSHAEKHKHAEGDALGYVHYTYYGSPYGQAFYFDARPLADAKAHNGEHHLILDFQAGKDVGLGVLGHDGSSDVNAGVRFASFSANSGVRLSGRPSVGYQLYLLPTFGGALGVPRVTFYQYRMYADATRSFKGVGPTLSWNASTALVGNKEDGELTLDWGINAAILFGKQKAKVNHTTESYFLTPDKYPAFHRSVHYQLMYQSPHHSTRSRSVTVPNIGGFAGLSLKWTNAKISVGYRYDTFLNAMDTGIDVAKKSNLTFNGPYASISIGLGD